MSRHRVITQTCAAVALVTLVTGCGRAGGQPFQPALNTPLTLDAAGGIGQTLNPPADTISRLDLSVATFGEPADPDGLLTVTVRPVQAPGEVSTAQVKGSAITDGAWVAAIFDPPAASDGVMLAQITWAGSTPLALWADVPLEGTEGIVNDPYAPGQLVIDQRPVAGDLAFRVRTGGGTAAAVGQLGQILVTAGARLVDQPVFLAVWLLGVSGAVWLAATRFKTVRGRSDPRSHRTTTP